MLPTNGYPILAGSDMKVMPMWQMVSKKEEPTLNVKVEKNSRGYNWEVSVIGAPSVEAAIELAREAERQLRVLYGEG